MMPPFEEPPRPEDMAPRKQTPEDRPAGRARHELDDRLADATMWAWYGPAFRLAFKHWPLSLAVGLAAAGLDRVLATLPWMYGFRWWSQLLTGYTEILAYGVVVVLGYRSLVALENVGTANERSVIVVRAIQVQTIWFIVGCLVFGAFALLSLAGVGFVGTPNSIAGLLAYGWLSLLISLVMFLLMPIWFSLMVASVLSDVYAVRSSETALSAVLTSLSLAFAQKWRVFWASYVLVILLVVVTIVVGVIAAFLPFGLRAFLGAIAMVVPMALAVPMMFVIERSYAAHLTAPGGEEVGAELPERPEPGTVPPPRVRTPPKPAEPLPSASHEIADRIVEDLRANRLQMLVEAVEQGIKADPRFFVAYPNETLAVAKRLAAVKRPDLALRLAQPYLKDHRTHRQHLTVALYVGNLLLRDLGRKTDAARFLGQVKTLYPHEPMVDQLIKITDKAIAGGADAPAGPGTS